MLRDPQAKDVKIDCFDKTHQPILEIPVAKQCDKNKEHTRKPPKLIFEKT